jgi:thiosulfate dehydrogenase
MQGKVENEKTITGLVNIINKLLLVVVVLVIALIALPFILIHDNQQGNAAKKSDELVHSTGISKKDTTDYWIAANINTITNATLKEQVLYGKELISHTSRYLGPKGSVLKMSNGMNCQNCHLQAGTVIFGNNYGSVASLFPKFRPRSGAVENVYKRVNDCFERSLNGKKLDTTGKEMQAIVSYINFIGSNVEKGKKAAGSGFKDLAWPDRAADPEKGLAVYNAKCISCHQVNGSGLFNPDSTEYVYPALFNGNSFNDGAGLYRIGNFAKYVKYNMPQGVIFSNPQLTDEEAWDVAAYVLSQTRPHINTPNDWPDKSKKPVDLPFGPYTDTFSEKQHKFGPFKPIVEQQQKTADAQKQNPVAEIKK